MTIQVWDVSTGNLKITLSGHRGSITKLAIHKNNLISISNDDTIRFWNIQGKTYSVEYLQINDPISLALFDLNSIAVGTLSGNIYYLKK